MGFSGCAENLLLPGLWGSLYGDFIRCLRGVVRSMKKVRTRHE